MTHEFDAVRESFASSRPGMFVTGMTEAVTSAWRTSAAGAAARSISSSMKAMPATSLIRTIAVAIALAALVQPILIALMPLTVAPAIPRMFFVAIGIFAVFVAWQADAIAAAWSRSTLARLIRR